MGFFRYVSSKLKTITHFGCDIKNRIQACDLQHALYKSRAFFNLDSLPFN